MEEKGIHFECDFHYPQTGGIDAFDVSIILNNGLSNAIEAMERESAAWQEQAEREMTFVSLESRLVKNMFMIELVNSYRGELQIDEASGLPFTSKPGAGHGFGLANIRHVARKYYGDVEIGKEIREGRSCCVLRVMLQLA